MTYLQAGVLLGGTVVEFWIFTRVVKADFAAFRADLNKDLDRVRRS